jgi:hypothetical protein
LPAARRAAGPDAAGDPQVGAHAQDEEDETDEEGKALTMQARENWARIAGRVESWTPPKDAEGHGEMVVHVERVSDVKGEGGKAWPNLLEKAAGATLRVQVPGSAAAGLNVAEGAAVTVDVRRGRDAAVVFANPASLRIGKGD